MNSFNKIHPFSMVSYFTTIIVVLMIFSHPILQVSALVSGGCYISYLNKCKNFISDVFFYIILFLLIAVTNPLFSHNGKTPLFFMNSNPVTLEAILKGCSISAMIIAVILWFGCMSKIFTSEKFLQLFGKLSPKLSLVLSMALNLVPTLIRKFKKIEESQKALGIYSCESRFDRLRLKLSTFISVAMFQSENSVEMSDSMTARGYGLKGRTTYQKVKFATLDCFIFLYSILTLVYLIWLEINGKIAFDYYPGVSELSIDIYSLVGFLCFAFLCFLPIFVEITENLKWKFLVSKV